MTIKVYSILPDEARQIRQRVFVEEQGFESEFDETDKTSLHFVAFDGAEAVGTCRIFCGDNDGEYILGRLAVDCGARGQGTGALLLASAENEARRLGARQMLLHSQVRASRFYEGKGYTAFGEVDYDEYCPHIWMKKEL